MKDTADKMFLRKEAEANEYAARVGGDTTVAMAYEIGALHCEYRILLNQLTPRLDKNTSYLASDIDDEEVFVEYEYDCGQEGREYGPPDLSWENIPPSVQLGCVWIKGACFDAGNFQQALLDKWEQAALDQELDISRDQYESRMAEKEY